MESYTDNFVEKTLWDHPNIAKIFRLEKNDNKAHFACFGEGISCKIILSVGLCTLQGIIYRKNNILESFENIKISDEFVYTIDSKCSNKLLMSEAQIVYFIQSLTSVAQYYEKKKDIHGDFNLKNISNALINQ